MSDLTADAKYLMNNAAFKNAMDDIKKELVDAAMACAVGDHEGRRLYLCLAKMADKFATRLATLAATTEELPDVANYYTEKQRSFFSRLAS